MVCTGYTASSLGEILGDAASARIELQSALSPVLCGSVKLHPIKSSAP